MVHDDERRMIAAFRARTVPDEDTKAELLDRLLAEADGHVAAPSWPRIGLAAGLALAIAAAVLLFIRGAVILFVPAAPRESDEAVHDATPPRTAPAVSREAAPVRTRPAPSGEPMPPAELPRPAPTQASAAGPGDALAKEAKLLSRAQAAMRDGDPERALAALAEHARRFPAGTMQLERDALHVIASCELDPQNASHAHAVLADPRAASYASRIRRACKL